MLSSITHQATAATVSSLSEASLLPGTDVPGIWSQTHITCCSLEVLSHIFGYLSCDDIAQVHDTCIKLREAVLAEHAGAFFYSQLSSSFRKQHQQSLPWQKRMVRDGLHPFATAIPGKEQKLFDTERRAAFLCFHTLGKMMSASGYQAVKVFDVDCPANSVRIDFSLNSSNLLRYSIVHGQAHVLAPDGPGSWSEQEIHLDDSGLSLLSMMCFNRDSEEPYYPCFSTQNAIEYLTRDHGRWQLTNQQWIEWRDHHEISPSGKHVAIYTHDGGIKCIRCLDDQGQWVLMPMWEGARINSGIEWLEFSPSGKLLAIQYRKSLAVLSLDNRGCWTCSETICCDEPTNYYEFCPSGRWLLVGLDSSEPKVPSWACIMRLDSAGKCISRQKITCKDYRLTFSPAGNYLVSCRNYLARCRNEKSCNLLLWQLLKSVTWVLYGNLTNPGAGPLPVGQTDPKTGVNKFSSCDKFLLTSSLDGKVNIWDQNEQGCWVDRGSKQLDGALKTVKFSQSGIHVLTVDQSSMHIWGRDEDGLWSVKGNIPDNDVYSAHFHPLAEHLIVVASIDRIRLWEIHKDDSNLEADGPA